MTLHSGLDAWFHRCGWAPMAFQHRTWAAYAAGRSGLVHAPTGQGKTLAVWLGPVSEWLDENDGVWPPDRSAGTGEHPKPPPIRVLWITPMRALATDTVESLLEPIDALGLPWTIEKRTGDTSSSVRARQAKRLPTCLVTTPESLSVLLSHADAHRRFKGLRCVIVDEWHELMSSKRGTQTELCLARLRRWTPSVRTWGLSATLGNVEQAAEVLVGQSASRPVLIPGEVPKEVVVETVIPSDLSRFPWAGHLGIALRDDVVRAIEGAGTTLIFCNTRSQCEIWFREINRARPDWLGRVALHHGSLDRGLRQRVEEALRLGRVPDLLSGSDGNDAETVSLKCVVCTSSLDLGVDFSPVDQVIQIGSPKGVARLIQRAGRSGHRPGVPSRVVCVPAHAFELVEFAAARASVQAQAIESRVPRRKPLDVLAQHAVTIAVGGGFEPDELLDEVRCTDAYRDLSDDEWGWVLDFITKGGTALSAYPDYQRVVPDEQGVHRIASVQLARAHRMSIGTITSDAAVAVKYANGKTLGTIEESFIAKLTPGDRFVFAGRICEIVRVRGMDVFVRRAKSSKGVVPRWGGSKTPLSTLLAHEVRRQLSRGAPEASADPELRAVAPLLDVQRAWSRLPSRDELLIERHETHEGHHVYLFPFEGRQVHEGLGSLLAHRIAAHRSITLSVTSNDYGVELAGATPLEPDELDWPALLSTDGLLDDLLMCLNSNELARRRFRDIARVAGLINVGFPGQGKSNRQLQASSELFFDVFLEYDPHNMLLDQARREVLDQHLEVERLRATLERLGPRELFIERPPRLTPLAFPLWAESLRTQHVSSESWSERIARMAADLEHAVGDAALTDR
ncbi:MAG: ligase-associated DNA damage response DEXH box helicase [Planctomycetota bacterium]